MNAKRIDRTLGEDTNSTHRYTVTCLYYEHGKVEYIVDAVDAPDADRRANNMFRRQFGFTARKSTARMTPNAKRPGETPTGFTALELQGRESMIEMGMSEDEYISRWPLSAYARKVKRDRSKMASAMHTTAPDLTDELDEQAARLLKAIETMCDELRAGRASEALITGTMALSEHRARLVDHNVPAHMAALWENEQETGE